MGWVTITHPFHPLRKQCFNVLKRRSVSGVPTLIVRHPDRGTLAVAEEWTDWAEPTALASLPKAILAIDALVELADLVNQLGHSEKVDG